MNPFTRGILKRLQNQEVQEFVKHWDALEALVIRVFKGKLATEQDETEYSGLRLWLLKEYPRWQAGLEPHWRQVMVAGEPAHEDPFALLLAVPQASGFLKNWAAMQNLPGAREALNSYLIANFQNK